MIMLHSYSSPRSFDIVNPTTLSYEFQWTQEEKPSHLATPIFNCHTPKGTITGGKKYTVTKHIMNNS